MNNKTRIIITILLLIITFTGCKAKESLIKETDNTSDKELSKGRYVEKNMELPSEVDYLDVVSIVVSPEGNLELYTNVGEVYEKYVYKNNEWSKEDVNSLSRFNYYGDDFAVSEVFYGEDGKMYLSGINIIEYRSALYRMSDEGKFEKINVKRFYDNFEEWQNLPYMPDLIRVLKNGMIAAVYPWRVIEVYSPDGETIINEFNCGSSCVMDVEGNVLYYTSQGDNEIQSVDLETGEERGSRSLETDVTFGAVLRIDNGTAYICNTKGIHLNKEGGTIWETVLEGSMSSVSMPSYTLQDFILGTDNTFYFVLSDIEMKEKKIKYVYYDENVSSEPSIELTIFSIDDNPTIRQAITEFQIVHPEARVNLRVANVEQKLKYTYGVKNPFETVSLKDQINTLNTELLAGQGADILVLDGMPIESYIEKGILEDMGSLFAPMIASGELFTNITDSFTLDGKVYAMPIRYTLPIIYGRNDAVEAIDSLERFAEYAKNSKYIKVLQPSNYRGLAAWFLLTHYHQIIDQDNKINEDKLRVFLEYVNEIAIAINASDDVGLGTNNTAYGTIIGYWIEPINVYTKEIQSNIQEVSGVMDFIFPLAVARNWQGSYKAINNTYKAKGIVGINSSSSNKELANEFIKLLFTKEIQKYDLMDGFPVNKKALEEVLMDDKEFIITMTDGTNFIEASYPSKEERDKLYESICAVDKPMPNNTILIDMILDEAERYLRGIITVEQAAKNAVESINTYLSE